MEQYGPSFTAGVVQMGWTGVLALMLLAAPSWAADRTVSCPPVPGAERYVLQVRAETGTVWRDVATYVPAQPDEAPALQYRCPVNTRKWLRVCAENAAGRTCQTAYGAWCSGKAD